jgi:serine/threonine protein kinase
MYRCTGGDIVSNCISRGGFSEHQVSDYIRQLLLSLDYLHNNKSVAHLGINVSCLYPVISPNLLSVKNINAHVNDFQFRFCVYI